MPQAPTIKLLLVDDKPDNLTVLEQLLTSSDRELLKATSGNDALRLLLKHDVALVLLDVEMPDIDGYEVAQLMRSADRTRLVPIIFVTAGDRSEERAFRGYEAGAVDFLFKPIDPHVLRNKVQVFIDLYRKSAELARVNAELDVTASALRSRIADLEEVHRSLSHDLRAPIRSIQSSTEMLADALGPEIDVTAREALTRVREGGQRLDRMVEGLFRLLRISADSFLTEEVDMAALADELVASITADARVTVTRDDLPTVSTVRALARQVLYELISNAVAFRAHEPLRVHLSAVRASNSYVFTVRDNGIGIPPAERERVFRLFQRGAAEGSGTGIGLALCQRALERLGGKIWVADAVRPGTTMCFTLPAMLPE